jgi:hypothetical protein
MLRLLGNPGLSLDVRQKVSCVLQWVSPIHDDVVLLVGNNNSSVGNAKELAIGRY